MIKDLTIEDLLQVLKEQQQHIERLELVVNELNTIIEEKVERSVSDSIHHHSKAMQRRIDQFIFDVKISLKNKSIMELDILENSKKKFFDEL